MTQPISVMEQSSKYHGKSGLRNLTQVVKKRSRDHMIENVGEMIEKHGYDAMKDSPLLKDGRKRTRWDDK